MDRLNNGVYIPEEEEISYEIDEGEILYEIERYVADTPILTYMDIFILGRIILNSKFKKKKTQKFEKVCFLCNL